MQKMSSTVSDVKSMIRPQLRQELRMQSEKCIECKLCRKECHFLQKYGSPKHIADTYDPASPKDRMMPFECSLCQLCAAVCPVKINPAAMFLEMRREAVSRGVQDFSDYGVIMNYEKRGASRRYSYYGLPENCETVLFPGCTLPGTRPDKVKALFDHLEQTIPSLGIVLDCCTKPSHDLGREKHFQDMFSEMKDYLLQHGVKNVLVACPNCYRVFKQYGEGLQVKTVYEHLVATSLPQTANIAGMVTVHDPCGTRNEEQIHAVIRRLATEKSLTIEEMKHHGVKTICCGEGGSVGCVNADFSKGWGVRRKGEAGGVRILTYCAGCANFLGGLNPTSHILDLLFEPEATLAGTVKISKAPWTYLNRLRLKSYFKKHINAAVSRERTFTGEEQSRGAILKRLAILLALVAVIVAVRMSGATQYLEQEKLRALIAGYGVLAPVIYMLSYAVAPALFLPGLPLTIVGGILFGPFWGVVYTIISATVGASVAFLVSRYIGRDWIESKLRSPRWKKLDEMVENHGWKAVAFTRLIPLFPFNLLNYAFGLTRVKFLHYVLATFFCMLPACIAYIVFSSSLLNVLRGQITLEFLIGIALIIGVSLIPAAYKKIKARRAEK
ncbi:MAG: VTT domain-containing protein [Proteobacteria bacterium]|nr:VTT domain-containing protein [Pseudomonadota bacterium]MBU0965659.1 VTT domain-containing protein [Pseudomonadota bacterium]